MVCFADGPIYNNSSNNMYTDNTDDDMPELEYPDEYQEEEEVIVNPAEDQEESEEQQRTLDDDGNERQPNDYEAYLEEMLDYYNDSLQHQPVFFPTTFDLPPQLSRGGVESGRPRQRQQQLLSEILYENLRVMFSTNDNN
jgi:hypothetical protein